MTTQAELLQFCRDYECKTLSEVLLAVAESSRHCTSEAGGRIPTWPLKEAASRLSEMYAENKRLREELQYVDDCFNAAMFEGWIDAKENGDVERIRDLWQRRISYAWSNTLNVLQDRAALTQGEQP